MALREELEKQGNWLFRWRSYMPLLFIPVLLLALPQAAYFERQAGQWAANCWAALCLFISFAGLGVRIVTIGYAPRRTSGRNTREQKAETLNTTGMYSLVRHPLYVGNCLMILGVALAAEVWWFAGLVSLVLWLYYERIIFAEEEFLRGKFGADFLAWALRTPAFLPRFENWQPAHLPFSVKTVLKREYSGFFGLIAAFTGLELAVNLFVQGKLSLAGGWIVFFSAGLIIYLTLRALKRKTTWLRVEGR